MPKLNNDVTSIFNKTLNGGTATAGNTCAILGAVNNKISSFIKPDGSTATTFKEIGSNAYLDIPAQSTVIFAVLEWHSTVASYINPVEIKESYNPITFTTPRSTNSVSINSTDSTEAVYIDSQQNKQSVKWVDVTNLVQVGGAGLYTVSSIPNVPLNETNKAPGWSLTVVYQNATLPKRAISIYIGIKQSSYSINKKNTSITLTGFTVPIAPESAYLNVVALNGDPNYYAGLTLYNDISMIDSRDVKYFLGNSIDSSFVNPNSGPVFPYDNAFSGLITNTNVDNKAYGSIDTRGTLGIKNNNPFDVLNQQNFSGNRAKLDILGIDISNRITKDQKQMVIAVDAKKTPVGSPQIILAAVVINQNGPLSSDPPKLTVSKASDKIISDLNIPITYTTTITNTSTNIQVLNASLLDPIPSEATFVADSLKVNGTKVTGSTMPTQGVSIGNINANSIVTVSYQVNYVKVPATNPVSNAPVLNYSYFDGSSNSQQKFTGTSNSLTITYAVDNTIKQIYNKTLNGGAIVIGNSAIVVGTTNNRSREFVKPDGTYTGDWNLCGSNAYLDIPTGSTIDYAVLEWHEMYRAALIGGQMAAKDEYAPIKFTTPKGVNTLSIPQAASTQSHMIYSNTYGDSVRWIDVTNIIANAGQGMYTVEGIPSPRPIATDVTTIPDLIFHPGWSLTVVYKNASKPIRNITINMGAKRQAADVSRSNRAVAITGLNIPSTPQKAYLTLVAMNSASNSYGGLSIYKDMASINNTGSQYYLGNSTASTNKDPGISPIVPYDNLFSGIIMNTNTEGNTYGQIETRGTLGTKNSNPYNINAQPSYRGNRARLDILSFDISSKISANQNQLVLLGDNYAASNNDDFTIASFVTQIDSVTSTVPQLVVTKSPDKTTATLQDTVTFTTTVTNTSNITANSVVLNDVLPLGTDFVNNSLTINGSNISSNSLPEQLNIGDLNQGGSVSIGYAIKFNPYLPSNNIENQPITNYSYTDTSGSVQNNTIQGKVDTLSVTLPTISNPVMSVVKTSEVSQIQVSDTITYKINVSITDGISARGTVLLETIPEGAAFVNNSLYVNGVSVPGSGLPVYGIPLGDFSVGLNPMAVITYKVTFNSLPSKNPVVNNPIINYQYANSDGTFTKASFTGTSTSLTVNPKAQVTAPQITLNKSVDKTSANIGDVANYTIVATNQSGATLANATLIDKVPQSSIIVMNSLTVNGKVYDLGQFFTRGISLNDIKAGQSAIIKYQLIFNDVPSINPVNIMPVLSYMYMDNSGMSQTGSITGTSQAITIGKIISAPVINVTKTSDNTNVNIGDVLTYTINLVSVSGNALEVVLKDTIPNNSKIIPNSLNINGVFIKDSNILTLGIPIMNMVPGTTAKIVYQVIFSAVPQVNPVSINPVLNFGYMNNGVYTKASITGTSTTVTINSVVIPPTINAIKIPYKSAIDTGEVQSYTITVTNTAGVVAKSAVLMETLSSNSSFIPNSLVINGALINGTNFPAQGINLGDIGLGDKVVITYKMIFNSVPATNPIVLNPIVNYSYVDDANVTQNNSFTGLDKGVLVNQNIIPPVFSTTKQPDKTKALVGEIVTYTISILNTKGSVAKQSIVIDTIDASSTFVANSLTINGTAVQGTSLPVTGISLGDIAQSSTSTITYKVIFNSIPKTNPIALKPTINYSYIDAKGVTNNLSTQIITTSLTVLTNTSTNPVVTVTKMSDLTTANTGDVITYTITVNNTAGSVVKGASLIDKIPIVASLVENSITVNNVGLSIKSLNEIGIPLGDIAVSNSVVVSYKVIFSSAPQTNPVTINPVLNYSYVDSTGVLKKTSLSGTSNSLNVNQIKVAPTLTLSKDSDKKSANIGDTVTYTIVLRNYSGGLANNLLLMDYLQPSAVFVKDSLTVNGNVILGGDTLSQGIALRSINVGDTINISYKVIFNSIPTTNPTSSTPLLNYSFVDTSGTVKNDTLIGTTTSLTVNQVVNPPSIVCSKTTNISTANIGDIITYLIKITNTGGIIANNVVLMEQLDNSSTLVPNSLTVNGNAINSTSISTTGINLGNLSVGDVSLVSYSITFKGVPTINPVNIIPVVNYSFVDSNGSTQNKSIQGTSKPVRINAELTPPIVTISKTTNYNLINVGDEITYSINIANVFGSAVQNAILIDLIDASASFVADSLIVNGQSIVGTSLPLAGINIGNISLGSIITVSYKVIFNSMPKMNPISIIPVLNYNYLSSAGTKSSSLKGTSSSLVVTSSSTVVPIINVSKSTENAIVNVGDTVTYTINIQNSGTVPISKVSLIDKTPLASSIVDKSLTINGAIASTNMLRDIIQIGDIAPNTSVKVSYKVIFTFIPPVNPVSINPVLNYSYLDSTGTIKTASFTGISTPVTVKLNVSAPVLTVKKNVDNIDVNIGDVVTYTVVIANTAGSMANSLLLFDKLPQNAMFIVNSLYINGRNIISKELNPNGIMLDPIPVGGIIKVSYKISFTSVPASNPVSINPSLNYKYLDTLGDIKNSSVLGEVTAVTVNQMVTPPNITINKTSNKTSVNLGEQTTFTITVTNLGGVTATAVILQERIPSGSSFVANSLNVNGTLVTGTSLPVTGIALGDIPATSSIVITYNVIYYPVSKFTFEEVTSQDIVDIQINSDSSLSYEYSNDSGLNDSFSVSGNSTQVNVSNQVNPPSILGTKVPNISYANVGDTITFNVEIMNTDGVTAASAFLKDTIPSEASFVPNSLIVNGTATAVTSFPSSGINLGDISAGIKATVSYKITFNSVPQANPVTINPVLNYNYINSDNVTQIATANINASSITINTVANDNSLVYISKSSDNNSANIGDIVTYTININNASNIKSSLSNLIDSIPQEAIFIPGSLTLNGNVVEGSPIFGQGLNIGDIYNSSTIIYKVIFKDIPSVNPVCLNPTLKYEYKDSLNQIQSKTFIGKSSMLTISSTITPPSLSINKSADKLSAGIGDVVEITINVLSDFGIIANFVVLKDSMPNGAAFVDNSLTVNGVSVSGDSIVNEGYSIGNVDVLDKFTVKYKIVFLSIPSPNPTAIIPSLDYIYLDNHGVANTITMQGSVPDSIVINAVVIPPSLSMIKTVNKSVAGLGEIVTYKITVSSTNGTVATNLAVIDTIPQNAQFIKDSLTINNTKIIGSTFPSSISLSNLINGTSSVVSYQVVFNQIPTTNPVSNTATLNYSYSDSNSITQNASITGTTQNLTVNNNFVPLVTAQKTLSKKAISVGDTVQFTITVTNIKLVDAINVKVLDSIPPYSTLVADSLTVNGVVIQGNKLPQQGINLAMLLQNSTAIVKYSVVFYDAPTVNPFASIPSVVYDYVDNNSSLVEKETVTATTDKVTVIKDPLGRVDLYTSQSTAISGNKVNYSLIIKNNGTSLATNVLIKDVIPLGLTYVANSFKVNNQAVAGDLNQGIVIPSIPAGQQSVITFQLSIN